MYPQGVPTDPLIHAIPESQRSALVGVLTAAGAAILWGTGTVATFVVLDAGVSTSIFTVIEIGSSIVFLTVMSLVLGSRLPSLKKNARVGALGILEPGLAYVLMNFGLARTSVTHAALLGATEPALIALLAWLLIGSKLPRRLLLPMGTALIGTVLVVTANATGSGANWFGDVLVALGFVSASLYAVGSSRVVEDMKPLTVAWIQQIFAFAVIAPPLIFVSFAQGVGSTSSSLTWLAIPIIGITSSSLTFWLYLTSLRHVSPGTTAQFLALIPVTGFLGAVFILGEETTTTAFIGAAIVLVSLMAIARMEHSAELEAIGARSIAR